MRVLRDASGIQLITARTTRDLVAEGRPVLAVGYGFSCVHGKKTLVRVSPWGSEISGCLGCGRRLRQERRDPW